VSKLTLNIESLDVQSFEASVTRERAAFVAQSTNTTPACCYTFGCGDSINQSC
jgi:hypothetical protein